VKKHVVIGFADGSRWVSPALSDRDAHTTSTAIGETWARRGAFTIGPIRSYGTESPEAVGAMFSTGQATKDLAHVFQHHLISEIARRLGLSDTEGSVKTRLDAMIGHLKARGLGSVDARTAAKRTERLEEQRDMSIRAGLSLTQDREAATVEIARMAQQLDAKINPKAPLAEQIRSLSTAMLESLKVAQTGAMHFVINTIATRLRIEPVPEGEVHHRIENLLQLVRYKLIQSEK
jgi:hypothetical protein